MLEIEDLVAGYGNAEVLHGVSLRAAEGGVTALLGANGAGKTTLMRAVAGLIRPVRGGIRFAGDAIETWPSDRRVEAGIALVPEGRMVFPEMTVEENLRVGAFARHARGHASTGLERAYALFPRLRERRRQLGATLSGGEQQMLAIGRGLMARPRLLLLDEPTLGLAPILAQGIFATVAALRAEGLTILIAEQDVRSTLAVADRGTVLESGRAAAEGEGAALLADPRIRTAYLGL
jgi:branched-chain amino acid transport system ATP-binding protein